MSAPPIVTTHEAKNIVLDKWIPIDYSEHWPLTKCCLLSIFLPMPDFNLAKLDIIITVKKK